MKSLELKKIFYLPLLVFIFFIFTNCAEIPIKKQSENIEDYKLEVRRHILKNWSFNKSFEKNQSESKAILIMKIMPSGEIENIWFEKKSGNDVLDKSAYDAIEKSNPLPSLPKSYNRPYIILGFIFGENISKSKMKLDLEK